MSRAKVWLASSAATVVVLSYGALAQETATYSYDGLGRLSGSTIAGGSNNGRTTGTCFDAAGNRSRYDVATSAPAACPAPTPTPTPSPTPTPAPTPTPTPTNQPPVANTDSASFNCSLTKTINVTANDTDPENNLPLPVISMTSGTPSAVWGSVVSSSSIQVSSNSAGTFWVSYVVADSLGAQSTGTVNLTVTGTVCQDGPPL